jgi:hypothetical protein
MVCLPVLSWAGTVGWNLFNAVKRGEHAGVEGSHCADRAPVRKGQD